MSKFSTYCDSKIYTKICDDIFSKCFSFNNCYSSFSNILSSNFTIWEETTEEEIKEIIAFKDIITNDDYFIQGVKYHLECRKKNNPNLSSDCSKCLAYYKKAIDEEKNYSAMCMLGLIYGFLNDEFKIPGIKENRNYCFIKLEQASEKNNRYALFYHAQYYLHHYNEKKYEELLIRSASLNYKPSLKSLYNYLYLNIRQLMEEISYYKRIDVKDINLLTEILILLDKFDMESVLDFHDVQYFRSPIINIQTELKKYNINSYDLLKNMKKILLNEFDKDNQILLDQYNTKIKQELNDVHLIPDIANIINEYF